MNATAMTTVPDPADAPDLDQFADSGMVFEIDGRRCLAGTSTDPADGRQDCLVEYAPPQVLTDRALLGQLVAAVCAQIPPQRRRDLVVRAQADLCPPAPLTRDISYLYLAPGDLADAPELPSGLRISAERTARSEAGVRQWLVRAFTDGTSLRGQSAGDDGIADLVDGLLAAPDRLSYLVVADGPDGAVPLAHATLRTGAADDLYGTPFVDLVDILVADGQDTRLLTACLVAACARHAAAAGLPLVGNVVHRRDTAQDPGLRVLASLRSRGWRPRDAYWRCALPDVTWSNW